jgi:hypothetical protein
MASPYSYDLPPRTKYSTHTLTGIPPIIHSEHNTASTAYPAHSMMSSAYPAHSMMPSAYPAHSMSPAMPSTKCNSTGRPDSSSPFVLAFDYDLTLTEKHTSGTPGSPLRPLDIPDRRWEYLLTEKSDEALIHLVALTASPKNKVLIITRAGDYYFFPYLKARLERLVANGKLEISGRIKYSTDRDIGIDDFVIGVNAVGFTTDKNSIPPKFNEGKITVISGFFTPGRPFGSPDPIRFPFDFDNGTPEEWANIKKWILQNYVKSTDADCKKTIFIDDTRANVEEMRKFLPDANAILANVNEPFSNVRSVVLQMDKIKREMVGGKRKHKHKSRRIRHKTRRNRHKTYRRKH